MDNIDINIDYYNILESNKYATLEEIKKNYKRLALKYHPDKNKDPSAIEQFHKVSTAYQILSNRELREKYDLLGEIPEDSTLKSPDEVLSEFLSKLDPNLNIFIKDTVTDIHRSICDSKNKTIWDILGSLDTDKIINSGSNLVKSILKKDKTTRRYPKFLKAKQVELSLDEIEPGANCIQLDYNICKNYSHIILSIGNEKFLLEIAYDIHTVHINNLEYEFQLEYVIPNFLETINNYDLVIYREIHYKYICHPFLLELGDKFNRIERNVKLGGYSNCICINNMGFYNPHKSINGNLYVYFIFSTQDSCEYRDQVDGLEYGETVDVLKYIKK